MLPGEFGTLHHRPVTSRIRWSFLPPRFPCIFLHPSSRSNQVSRKDFRGITRSYSVEKDQPQDAECGFSYTQISGFQEAPNHGGSFPSFPWDSSLPGTTPVKVQRNSQVSPFCDSSCTLCYCCFAQISSIRTTTPHPKNSEVGSLYWLRRQSRVKNPWKVLDIYLTISSQKVPRGRSRSICSSTLSLRSLGGQFKLSMGTKEIFHKNEIFVDNKLFKIERVSFSEEKLPLFFLLPRLESRLLIYLTFSFFNNHQVNRSSNLITSSLPSEKETRHQPKESADRFLFILLRKKRIIGNLPNQGPYYFTDSANISSCLT